MPDRLLVLLDRQARPAVHDDRDACDLAKLCDETEVQVGFAVVQAVNCAEGRCEGGDPGAFHEFAGYRRVGEECGVRRPLAGIAVLIAGHDPEFTLHTVRAHKFYGCAGDRDVFLERETGPVQHE